MVRFGNWEGGRKRLKWKLWKEIIKFGHWDGGRRKIEINIVKEIVKFGNWEGGRRKKKINMKGNSKVWLLRKWEKKDW